MIQDRLFFNLYFWLLPAEELCILTRETLSTGRVTATGPYFAWPSLAAASVQIDEIGIVQEAFVRANNTLDGYLKAPEMHPVVWLRLIAKHVVTETHRRHFRDKRSPAREQNWVHENEDPLVNSLADSMRSVGSTVDSRELFEKVREKLTLLSENDREMLEMRHVEGLSLEEAAASLELTVEAAKKRYYRALKRFKEIACELI